MGKLKTEYTAVGAAVSDVARSAARRPQRSEDARGAQAPYAPPL